MLHYNLLAYHKIKAVAESCETMDHIIVLGNMINNFIDINDELLYKKRSKVFGLNILKWYKNYKEYNRYNESLELQITEITNIFNNIVEQHNQLIQEQQMKENEPAYYKPVVIQGFRKISDENEQNDVDSDDI